VRGQSLASLFDGTPPPDLRETVFSQVADHEPRHQGTSVRSRRLKYIRTRTLGEEFYEVERDPGELRNLLPPGGLRDELVRLRDELDQFESTISQEAPELDEETARQLRALGYLEGP
jgi:hypothetical protein